MVELRQVLGDRYGVNTTEGSDDINFDGNVSVFANRVVKSATATLTSVECKGTLITTYGQSVEMTLTLPECEVGLNGMVQLETVGAGDFHLKSDDTNTILLNGVLLDTGDKVTCLAPQLGDFLTYWVIQTGASSYDWVVETGRGNWADGGQ